MGGKTGWRDRREYYTRNISTLEPFLESLPQLVIKSCIWTFFKQRNLENIQGNNNPLFSDGVEAYFFYFSICLSALGTILGVVRFFKDSPVRFLPQTGPLDGFFTLKYLLAFFSVLCNAAAKVQLLVLMMFYSLGVFQVLSPPHQNGLDLVGSVSHPRCDNLTLLQLCEDGFQVRPQVLETNPERMRVNWDGEGDPEWRVFRRAENNGVITFWNTRLSQWMEGQYDTCLKDQTKCQTGKTNNCGGPKESLTLYCSDDNLSTVTISRLVSLGVWLLLNVIPQFLFASITLFLTQKKGFLHVAMHFPELLASPFITNIMFGPQDTFWCGKPKSILIIKMKRKLTWCSVIISVTGQVVSLFLMSKYYTDIYDSRHHTFTTFLSDGYLPFYTDFFPPITVLVCLGMSVVSLYVLIHLDDWGTSDIPFLAPLYCYDIQLTAQGIKYKYNWSRNIAIIVTNKQCANVPACEDQNNLSLEQELEIHTSKI